MTMKSVEIKFTNELAKKYGLPDAATKGSAGLDLRAFPSAENVVEVEGKEYFTLEPNQVLKVSAGISLHLADPTLVGLIYPRSGTSTKQGIVLANVVGVIDSDYQGEIILALRNQSNETQRILVGERVAQLVITPIVPCIFELVNEFSVSTERGECGFGSSGKL